MARVQVYKSAIFPFSQGQIDNFGSNWDNYETTVNMDLNKKGQSIETLDQAFNLDHLTVHQFFLKMKEADNIMRSVLDGRVCPDPEQVELYNEYHNIFITKKPGMIQSFAGKKTVSSEFLLKYMHIGRCFDPKDKALEITAKFQVKHLLPLLYQGLGEKIDDPSKLFEKTTSFSTIARYKDIYLGLYAIRIYLEYKVLYCWAVISHNRLREIGETRDSISFKVLCEALQKVSIAVLPFVI